MVVAHDPAAILGGTGKFSSKADGMAGIGRGIICHVVNLNEMPPVVPKIVLVDEHAAVVRGDFPEESVGFIPNLQVRVFTDLERWV